MKVNDEYVEIDLKEDIGLTDAEITFLIRMAYENNMTLEEFVIKVLSDYIDECLIKTTNHITKA